MTLDSDSAAQILARALSDERLIAVVGAAASARYRDPKGREYEGVPTPGEILGIARSRFRYLDSTSSFNVTFDTLLDREKRASVEEFLLQYYKVPEAFEPPPSHRLLAWLPFSLYITSNYDQFIERALEKENRRPFALIDNDDLVRIRRWNTPVVKYHGCVSRPSTLVAATHDYDHLQEKRNLIRNFVSASLGGGHVLVVGHGLGDSDLSRVLFELVRDLGKYAPTIYVLRPPGHDGRLPGLTIPHEVIVEDLTEFLNRLLHEFRGIRDSSGATPVDSRWFSSSFFGSLRKATVLPSETQVIDAFLGHLAEEISARPDVQGVMEDAAAAVESALHERPNYGALKRVWSRVKDAVGSEIEPHLAEIGVRDFVAERQSHIQQFSALGRAVVRANERILLYSQSQRVLQLLRGVPTSVQRTVHLFVCECRPKSPKPYEDAAATCLELSNTEFKVTVCPDVVGMNLLATSQIDKVVVGTHALFCERDADDIYAYVNTCGTDGIAEVARRHDIPVIVVGERLKLEVVPLSSAADHLYPHQENDLTDGARNIRSIATKRGDIGHLNIGYDLVSVSPNTQVLIPDGTGIL